MEKSSQGSSSVNREYNKTKGSFIRPPTNDDYWARFPRGTYFKPRDEELIKDYLYRNVNNLQLPLNKIYEVDVYSVSPDQLSSSGKYKGYRGCSEMYFFTSRERKYPKGKRPRRDAGDGWWKATGTDKIIHCGHGTRIGRKKVLVFHSGKDRHKTDWVMHEYELSNKDDENDKTKFERTVLCKIYKKKASNGMNFMMQGAFLFWGIVFSLGFLLF